MWWVVWDFFFRYFLMFDYFVLENLFVFWGFVVKVGFGWVNW